MYTWKTHFRHVVTLSHSNLYTTEMMFYSWWYSNTFTVQWYAVSTIDYRHTLCQEIIGIESENLLKTIWRQDMLWKTIGKFSAGLSEFLLNTSWQPIWKCSIINRQPSDFALNWISESVFNLNGKDPNTLVKVVTSENFWNNVIWKCSGRRLLEHCKENCKENECTDETTAQDGKKVQLYMYRCKEASSLS